jgi:hypothetical protein
VLAADIILAGASVLAFSGVARDDDMCWLAAAALLALY